MFIVHAPYKLLKRPPDFLGETRLMETLSIRALFSRPEDFIQKTGLGQLSDDTVVTGVFQSGNASRTFGFGPLSVDLAIGAGTYLYQFRSQSATKYCFGTFQNARADASVSIVTAVADLSLAQGPVTTGRVGDLEEFFARTELTMSGTLILCACADALPAPNRSAGPRRRRFLDPDRALFLGERQGRLQHGRLQPVPVKGVP